jgi:hypothetical protein
MSTPTIESRIEMLEREVENLRSSLNEIIKVIQEPEIVETTPTGNVICKLRSNLNNLHMIKYSKGEPEVGEIYVNKNHKYAESSELNYTYVVLSCDNEVWKLVEFCKSTDDDTFYFGTEKTRLFSLEEIREYLELVGKI